MQIEEYTHLRIFTLTIVETKGVLEETDAESPINIYALRKINAVHSYEAQESPQLWRGNAALRRQKATEVAVGVARRRRSIAPRWLTISILKKTYLGRQNATGSNRERLAIELLQFTSTQRMLKETL